MEKMATLYTDRCTLSEHISPHSRQSTAAGRLHCQLRDLFLILLGGMNAKTRSSHIAQDGLEIVVLLPPDSEDWDDKHEPP